MVASSVTLVVDFPRCAGCGEEARYVCPVCQHAFCTPRGCPGADEHHQASIELERLAVFSEPGDSGIFSAKNDRSR